MIRDFWSAIYDDRHAAGVTLLCFGGIALRVLTESVACRAHVARVPAAASAGAADAAGAPAGAAGALPDVHHRLQHHAHHVRM